jgi:hypothetical protein
MTSYRSSADGESRFPSVKQAQSECFYYNNDSVSGSKVTEVTFTVTETLGSGTIVYWIGYSTTIDGTITWEEISRSGNELDGITKHTLASSGNYFLFWRAKGYNGAINSRLKIKVWRG